MYTHIEIWYVCNNLGENGEDQNESHQTLIIPTATGFQTV